MHELFPYCRIPSNILEEEDWMELPCIACSLGSTRNHPSSGDVPTFTIHLSLIHKVDAFEFIVVIKNILTHKLLKQLYII
jgi:hypothetical protein